MKIIIKIYIYSLLFFVVTTACGELPARKLITVKALVVGEDKKPIKEANVIVFYDHYLKERDYEKSVLTNEEGKASLTGLTSLRVEVMVRKEGYYETFYTKSKGRALERDKDHDMKIILRKKITPIPMYAKKVEAIVPVLNQKCGFDLEKSDWVAPYGIGKHADFIFTANKMYTDRNNYETHVKLTFSNTHEGIQQDSFAQRESPYFVSAFQTSRIAPKDGYKNEGIFITRKRKKTGRRGSTLRNAFVFRSRVILDKNGKIMSAHYGKLRKAVNVSRGAAKPDQNPIIQFTCYFNPTPNDRNLEFDPKRNLFQKLDIFEEVNEL